MTRKKDADIKEEEIATDDTDVLDENSLLCLLTNEPKKRYLQKKETALLEKHFGDLAQELKKPKVTPFYILHTSLGFWISLLALILITTPST